MSKPVRFRPLAARRILEGKSQWGQVEDRRRDGAYMEGRSILTSSLSTDTDCVVVIVLGNAVPGANTAMSSRLEG